MPKLSVVELAKFPGVSVKGSSAGVVSVGSKLLEAFNARRARLSLQFAGSGAVADIEIGSFTGSLDLRFKGGENLVRIGDCRQINLDALFYAGSSVTIGDRTSINSCVTVLSDARIDIGEDCMFSHDVLLQPCDQHGIIDVKDGTLLEQKREIVIGRHVWLAKRASICPGAVIGDGAIVGLGAVVAGRIEPATIVVGNPARAIRSGVTWTRDNEGHDVLAHDLRKSLRSDSLPNI